MRHGRLFREYTLDETVRVLNEEMLPRKITLIDGTSPLGLYHIRVRVEIHLMEEE